MVSLLAEIKIFRFWPSRGEGGVGRYQLLYIIIHKYCNTIIWQEAQNNANFSSVTPSSKE